ncbi:MAG: hypothetical protein KC613_23505, partial [Myxococcales bacterium]|nr:hypothetical protein [Myxococcales bacterium]
MMRWIMAAATLALVGCGGGGKVMYSDGFVHPKHPYMVRDAGGGNRIIPDWTFINYELGDSGAPESPKLDAQYRLGISLDVDNDQTKEYFEDIERYDVLLVNSNTGSKLFVRTLPLTPQAGNQTLEQILSAYLLQVGQDGDFGADVPSDPPKGQVPKFATRIVRQGPAEVAGIQGLEAVVERADVPKAAVDNNTQWERLKVRMVKPDFKWVANGKGIPAVMMVGYVASAANFNKDLAKFNTLLESVEFIEDWQVVQLQSGKIIDECLPQPPAFKLSMTVNAAGRRTDFGVAPEQGEDVRLCIMDLLDKIQFAARDNTRSFKVDIARGLNPLKAKPKPAPKPVAAPVPTPVVEPLPSVD